MDQDAVVNEQAESGKRLIAAVEANGFEVRVAFWAKLTDEGNWYLYLASPFVEENGGRAAYGVVLEVLRKQPDIWIDSFEIRVIGLKDTLAKAALEVVRPRGSDSQFAVKNPRPYPGLTRFGGASLGGVSIDGAFIYPPSVPVVPA